MSESRCVVMGAGGHARALMDALRGCADAVAVLDRDESLWGTRLGGVPIVGGDDRLPDLIRQGVTHYVLGFGSIGDTRARRRVAAACDALGLRALTVRHPGAIVSPNARVGEGCQLMPGSIVNAGADLGAHVIVNSGAIVEHDCRIGDFVHVATGAVLAGSVAVESDAHIGCGATVLQGRRIGAHAIVGGGAVVVSDVPSEVTVIGVPARVLRQE